jgi:pSer/pThr/pTyr-binding forkhead associated (FHA) protein
MGRPRIWVEDLKSTNGTRKNGEIVGHARSRPATRHAIGPVMVST